MHNLDSMQTGGENIVKRHFDAAVAVSRRGLVDVQHLSEFLDAHDEHVSMRGFCQLFIYSFPI